MNARRRVRAASLVLFLLATSGCAPAVSSPDPTGAPPTDAPTLRPTAAATTPIRIAAPVRVRVQFAQPTDDPVMPLPQAPPRGAIAVAGGAIWISPFDGSYKLLRFDLATERFTAEVPLDYAVALLTGDDGTLWAIGPVGYAPGPKAYTISRINLETGRLKPVASVPVGGVAVGAGSIWAAGSQRLERIDLATGETSASWDIDMHRVQFACGAAWAAGYDDGLVRIDPDTGDTDRFDGEGPLYPRSDGCWHWVEDGIERVWPRPATTTKTAASAVIWFEGSTFWHRLGGSMQRWDPVTGAGVGPTWLLDRQDINSYWKIGDDGLVLSAGGRVWLVNGWEVVGFEIPSDQP